MHKDCIAYKKDKAIHVIADKEMIGPVNERVAVDSYPLSKRTFDEEEGAIYVLVCLHTGLGRRPRDIGHGQKRQLRHLSRRTDVGCGENGWEMELTDGW